MEEAGTCGRRDYVQYPLCQGVVAYLHCGHCQAINKRGRNEEMVGTGRGRKKGGTKERNEKGARGRRQINKKLDRTEE